MRVLDPRSILEDGVLEVRGDGKAGGGLVLAFQSLAALFSSLPNLHVQEWPFFSSARRGANIRSYVRVSARPIRIACEVTNPTLVLLMDEGAARTVDFAQGVPPGGTFVLNTRHTPEVCAKHYGLSGRVITISGDEIGLKHLRAQIGNVSAYVAMAHAIGGFTPEAVFDTFLSALKKRRIPETVLQRNREALEASLSEVKEGVFDEAKPGTHLVPPFAGYGDLPVGAQTALRLSQDNLTAYYARTGVQLHFEDPEDKCTGCGHCITNCPEGIIHWEPNEKNGLKVTGSDVTEYCKLCAECISVCPENLFSEIPFNVAWKEAEVSS